MAVIIPSSTQSGLPAPGNNGSLYRLTDSTRGVWMDEGASWASVQAEIVNVKQFGARGNNSNNDTSAIQAALDAVAATGGRVYFPPGVYLIHGTLTPKANTVLEGAGKLCSIIKLVATGQRLLSGPAMDRRIHGKESISEIFRYFATVARRRPWR